MILTAAATCLALNMFFEARHESVQGQIAVADVTLTRVADSRYPDTVCDVVWDKKQFSWTHDGVHDDPTRMSYLDQRAWESISKLAVDILDNPDNLLGLPSTHYHSVAVSPFWASHYEKDGQLGNHIFYTNETPYK